ncbi:MULTISPECIES: nucleoside hydrolase [Brevibacterium]|nr:MULTISPECIES: nucleoside hydrolase [Brevibacterium]
MSTQLLPVFLDCDPGIDDAVALGYLLCQHDVEILGIAASGGNVPTAQVARNTLGWLDLAGRSEIPVHEGAELPTAWQNGPPGETAHPEFAELTHGPSGTGHALLPEPRTAVSAVDAAHAWVDAARARPGELIGVLIGPATNLALALDIEPRLPDMLKRLFIMGGAFNHRGNTHPTTEWNITFDPEAMAAVLAAFGRTPAVTSGPGERQGCDRQGHLPVIAPIDATEAIEMTPVRLDGILATDARADETSASTPRWQEWLRQLAAALRFYFEFHESDGFGHIAHLHDPFVLACALAWGRDHLGDPPSPRQPVANGTPGRLPWARTLCAPVDVELTGTLTRGETVADWLGRWGRDANAEIIRTIDAAAFLDHLGDTLRQGPRPSEG